VRSDGRVDDARADYLFFGQADDTIATNCGLGRAASSLLTGAVAVGPTPVYLADYTLVASPDAAGSTFEISFAAMPDTILADESAGPIDYTLGPVCTLSVGGCVTGADCDDGDTCSTDICNAGVCAYVPSGLCTIDGMVLYYRDHLASSEPSTKGVPNVDIDLTSDLIADETTIGDGTWSSDIFGNVEVTTLDKFGTPRASDHNDAVTSLDASAIARHAA